VAESITYDFISRGADRLAGDFRKTGDSAAAAARGAKVLQEVIKELGQKEDRTAAQSKILAAALRQTGDAEDRAAAKAVLADAAIRRLDDAMQDSSKHSGELGKALGGLKLNPGLLGPALALAPAIATLGGVVTGVAAGLSGAFVAGGAALAAFGAVAKPVLTDAKTAATAVETAQNNYAAAIAGGTKKAVAYKAEQIAIAKAYANLSPAQIVLSKQIGAMAASWDAVKAAETPVVAGALQPWLKSVTDLTGKLGPVIAGVSPFIRSLGAQFDGLVNSSAFTGFRDFIAGTGSAAAGAAGHTIIDLVKSFVILLPQFNPLIDKAIGWISELGPAVLKWSASKKASDDITRFMAWFTANGPVVGTLLKNIGGALKALTPGLTTGGVTELNLISGFFAFVAKLPPSLAKPLAEVAGSLLILNKLGVISVGVKIIGPAVKWLTGGIVDLGGGAAAGAEIRAAMVSGGVAAGAEIRAAMAGGAAADGAAVGGSEAVAMKAGAPAIGTLIGLAAVAQIAGFLAYQKFSNAFSSGVKGSSAAGQSGSSGESASLGAVLAGTGTNLAAKLRTDLGPADALLKSLGYSQDAIGQINKAVLKPGSNVAKVDALIYQLGGTQADILAVNKLIVKPGSNAASIDSLLKRIGLTPGQIAGVNKLNLKPGQDPVHVDAMLHRIGLTPPQIASVNRLILKPHSDTTPVTKLQQAIDSLHGKTVNVLMHAAGSGSIVFNESTGVGSDVKGGLKFMAAGGKVFGGRPGKDSVLGMLTPGEVVVPAGMVRGGAVDHLRGKLPGFAAGGYVPNYAGAENWMAGSEYGFGRSVENSYAVRLIGQLKTAVKQAAAQAAATAKAGLNNLPLGLGPHSGSAAVAQAFARSILFAYGWGQNQFPSLQALWNQECTSLDTRILTRRGWLAHDEVRTGDETVGYNPETGRSEWTRITRVVHYDDAEVWRIGGQRWHADVTPGHRWWSDYRQNNGRGYVQEHSGFAQTAELTRGDRIRLAAPADTDGIAGLSTEDAAVLAWLQGDGHIQRRGKTEISARIYQSKPEQITRLRALLAHIEHTEVVSARTGRPESHRPEHVFLLRAGYVRDLLKRSGLDETGPEQMVLRMSPDQRAAWLAAMIDAEGTAKGGYTIVFQNDGDLADAIKLAVYLEGHRPNVRVPRSGYQAIGLGNPHVAVHRFESHEVLERQPVWCVTTELGSWTAQQDGQAFLTGNSGWNSYAVNPSSGAYGIPQALGKGHPYNLGDYQAQIRWGLSYIWSRYGSPAAAEGHELAYNWYDRGGLLKPGLTLAYNGTGRAEQVIPAGGGGSSGGGGAVNVTVNINAPVGSQAELQAWFERSFSALAYTGKARRILKQTGGT